ALRDLDRRRLGSARLRARCPRGRRAERRRCDLEPWRGPARDRRVGNRRRRVGRAEGADDTTGPGDGLGVCCRLGRSRPVELAALLRDRHGVTLAPGQGELKGKIFRIGHIGYYDVFDITTALAAVELGLVELGAEVERGVAVTRALEAFERTPV